MVDVLQHVFVDELTESNEVHDEPRALGHRTADDDLEHEVVAVAVRIVAHAV